MCRFLSELFSKKEFKEKPVIITGITENKIEINETIETMEETVNKDIAPNNFDTIKMFNNLVVVLDPGHAKSTGGKRSPYSLGKVSEPCLPFEEWQFSRDIANIVKPMLESYGIEVFITTDFERDGDIDLGLSKRAERANNYIKKSGKKGLFISIHADADGMGNKWTKAHGWSCFTTKGQNNSDKLADCLYDAAEDVLPKYGLAIRTDKSDGDMDWESDFTVLFKANVPAVLTENLFYTNIEDTKFLNSEEGKNEIAKIHLNGVIMFAEKVYKM